LKEEAINILKAFKEFEDTDKHNWSFNGQIEKLKQLGIKEFFDFEEGDNGRLKDFIKHFFNISSEDLIEKVEGIDTSEGKITKVKGHKEGNVIVIDKITQEDLK